MVAGLGLDLKDWSVHEALICAVPPKLRYGIIASIFRMYLMAEGLQFCLEHASYLLLVRISWT
jgi:hypothetical protein